MKRYVSLISLLLVICLFFSGCGASLQSDNSSNTSNETESKEEVVDDETLYPSTVPAHTVSLSNIPDFSGKPYVEINGNVPQFDKNDYTTKSYEHYSNLDSLDRCSVAVACIGQDLMPTEDRGSIGQVKPTGWHTVKYDCVDGKYLYNRCHLIGYQLSGENTNTKNLITGTRYMNISGMLPFENMVADYVKETGNHVLYRVTPLFDGNNLLATGVQMEGYSVEDEGDGIFFNVFVYNAQPEISINYANGESSYNKISNDNEIRNDNDSDSETNTSSASYILNKNTKKFHYPECYSVDRMSEKNKEYFTGNRQELINHGYAPCGNCNP